MISNAELYLASKGRVARPRMYELLECMRVEFPNKEMSEIESDIERTTVLLRDLRRVNSIAKRAVDNDRR